MSTVVEGLRAAMADAMRARDRGRLRAIRSALGAIDNAAAIPAVEFDTASGAGPIAGAAIGVGATEVTRRHLTDEDIAAIVRMQIAEHRAQAIELDRLGQAEAADALRRDADVLDVILTS
ncbi:MAG: hypothetical protein ACK5OX_07845 [Desertimonas sp.]